MTEKKYLFIVPFWLKTFVNLWVLGYLLALVGPSTWVQIQLKNSQVDGAYKILYFWLISLIKEIFMLSVVIFYLRLKTQLTTYVENLFWFWIQDRFKSIFIFDLSKIFQWIEICPKTCQQFLVCLKKCKGTSILKKGK